MTTPSPAPEATMAGNYFISNYPPFPLWKPGHVREAMAALDRRPADPATPLGVYLHIPFCRKRCHFCYFKVYTGKNAEEVGAYVDALAREHELYAASPLIAGRKPSFVYFGGGTPSYLSQDVLARLAERLQRALPWDEAEEVAFEAEPGTLNPAKLKAIRATGVTRLSLGVESFVERVLEVNGRAHRAADVPRAYEAARAAGFPQINIDLIAGMLEDDEAGWNESVRRTVELLPDSVTIYQMEIPFNTGVFKGMRERGDSVAPVADWPTKRAWVRRAFEALEAAGYTVTSGYTAVRDPERTRFVYRDRLWTGADMPGLGVASFGHLDGAHLQNEKDIAEYVRRVNAGELPVKRALVLKPEERPIRELILQLKLGRVSREYFKAKFGLDLYDRYAEPLARLEADGVLKRRDDDVVLSREGLLQVDRYLPEFFLPEHRRLFLQGTSAAS